MRAAGAQAEFDPVDVIRWFHDATDPLRVIALNLMLANEDYRDFLAALETIDTPHSNGACWQTRSPARSAKRRFRHDEPLMGASHHLLDRLVQAS